MLVNLQPTNSPLLWTILRISYHLIWSNYTQLKFQKITWYTNKITWLTSSGTALMLVKPFLNTMYTLRAPQRNADVAQSNAVSPTPNTITLPWILGSLLLQAHIPVKEYTHIIKIISNMIPHFTAEIKVYLDWTNTVSKATVSFLTWFATLCY